MQSYIALLLACFVSAISADVTCDDCLAFAGNMQTHLMGAESVAEQTKLLATTLCPTSPDPAMCDSAIREWWSKIAAAMYSEFLEPNSICSDLGPCKVKSLVRTPTCDECKGAIGALSAKMQSEETIVEISEFLLGGICAGDDVCSTIVNEGMPYIMPVLAAALVAEDAEHCCEQSPSGVCC